MVLLAFVLLTVSTLATLTNALPKDLPVVRHECGDETLCHIKPEGYPQEEIDRVVLKHLPHLRRLKRHIIKSADPEPGGNCAYTETNSTIYTIRNKRNIPMYLLNSKWFTQNITQVRCKDRNPNSPCFSQFLATSNLKTRCETREVTVSLLVYSPQKGVEEVKAPIGIDCACVIDNSVD